MVLGAGLLLPWLACAQEVELENNPPEPVPVQAEATTAVVPGNADDGQQRPSRAYTDGQLADPTPKAADLGMAQPGSPITLPADDADTSD
ncbi:MAG: hypothetical protein DI582_06985 [Azospirillum brasilense]|nr:MAG: hypothetical protein DI582_06985 [Azospirillum brasilense]